jgi:hypothetical protein
MYLINQEKYVNYVMDFGYEDAYVRDGAGRGKPEKAGVVWAKILILLHE